ncbi:serine/threonine-protein kinase pim-1-like [Cheilinus undulatus]|uniref:serine/threonine-protein kinase pim-1-like n=1 Tax=Cheilinus undulatus TaxID=241271 RepID=UPI001BD46828|nr:serine/threonine-protein kinase pim-1-like [Cheilinus undulatus]
MQQDKDPKRTTSQNDSDHFDDPVIESGSAEKQAKKRKSSKKADGQDEKRLRISAPLEDVTTAKRKCDEKEEPRKRSRFEKKYQQLSPLGKGGFGCVYTGYRREDNFPVAIKHIPKNKVRYHEGVIPMEVAVLQRLTKRKEVVKSAAISLLDFYEQDDELILVLECPVPAVDLFKYTLDRGKALEERECRLIVKQLIEAAWELESKMVFHGDILIETNSDAPRIRLIDIGHTHFASESTRYRDFNGTPQHNPPEWYKHGSYTAGSSTVWQIGIILFDLLHWDKGLFDTKRSIIGEKPIREDLSSGCRDLLCRCLSMDPQTRPSLMKLTYHRWFKEGQP